MYMLTIQQFLESVINPFTAVSKEWYQLECKPSFFMAAPSIFAKFKKIQALFPFLVTKV